VMVKDLTTVRGKRSASHRGNAPASASENMEKIFSRIRDKKVVVFLDYDGTLTPIVDDPEKACLSDSMRAVLKTVADHFPLAVISGRDLSDIQNLIGMQDIYYAGSHGFDIVGPGGMRMHHQKGANCLPSLDRAEKALKEKVNLVPGAWIERKRFSIAIHYRKVKDDDVASVKEMVTEIVGRHTDLRRADGKKVLELQPKIDWHKGKALLWLLDKLELDNADVVPIYMGDDVTDEDAFTTLQDRGIGIVVMDQPRPTNAQYRVDDPGEVEQFLRKLVSIEKGEDG